MAFARRFETAMSKVYSFRLDENNPREVQAMRVIEAWVSQGYSLRRIIVDAVISSQRDDITGSNLEKKLYEIIHLLETMKEGKESITDIRKTLPEAFVGSISKSVKSGIRWNDIE